MANKNTIYRYTAGPLPGDFLGASSTAAHPLTDANGDLVAIEIPANLLADKDFAIRVLGDLDFGLGNVTVIIRVEGETHTLGTLATSGALAFAADGSFRVEFTGRGDSRAGKLRGRVTGHTGNVIVTEAASGATITDGLDQKLTISATVTFASSDAGNGGRIQGLEIDIL